MKEENNPIAGEQSNTQVNAEEQSNTITIEQFTEFAKANNIQTFSNEDFDTFKTNHEKDVLKKNHNSIYAKGLDKAKHKLAEKLGLTLEEESKFDDALELAVSKKGNTEDFTELQKRYEDLKSVAEREKQEIHAMYRNKALTSTFESVYNELSNTFALADDQKERFKGLMRTAFMAEHQTDEDGIYKLVGEDKKYLKDDKLSPLTAREIVKNYLLSEMPIKKQVNSGLGIDGTGQTSGLNHKSLEAKSVGEFLRLVAGEDDATKMKLQKEFIKLQNKK